MGCATEKLVSLVRSALSLGPSRGRGIAENGTRASRLQNQHICRLSPVCYGLNRGEDGMVMG